MMRCFVVFKKNQSLEKKEKEGRLFPTYGKFFNVKTLVFGWRKLLKKGGGIVFKKTGYPQIYENVKHSSEEYFRKSYRQ